MKKAIAMLLVLTIWSAVLTGCGSSRNQSSEKREISPSGQSAKEMGNNSQDTNTEQENDQSDTSILDEGTISSLDEIKQKALDAGYEIEELKEIQMPTIEGFEMPTMEEIMGGVVDGFYMLIDDTYTPVMEFANPNDAQAYADMINESGYNVAIVNGRFVSFVEANKGIIVDDNLQAEIERIMDAKAQVQDQWTDTQDVPIDTTDYSSAYALLDNIRKSMNTLLDQSLTINNKAHPEGDPKNTDGVIPLLFGSITMGFTAYFGEDETYYEGIVSVAEMVGITESKVTRNAAHDYTLSGKERREKLPYEVHGVYDPATGSLRMVEKTDGKVTEFFEFVPLGNDQYAYQTNKERAMVIYRNGQLESFIYTKIDNNDTDYDLESQSIYPTGAGVNNEWVAGQGEDGYAEYYFFDGTTIKLSVETYSGRVKVEIPV